MVKKLLHLLFVCFLLFSGYKLKAQTETAGGTYHTNQQIQEILKKLNKKKTKLHSIAISPGGQEITVLEIGAGLEDVPAIFVGANFEGDVPLSTEGALYFAQMLLDSSAYTKNIKWYIMPQPNPDAAEGYFSDIKSGLNVNKFAINDDGDEAINEDGFDDLNNDGFITQMRIKDVEGDYIISKTNPLLMEKANKTKGERGIYKVYSEGIDNDKDGMFNEDGEGGINVGIAFPHLFPREKSEAGMYAGQTPEVYGIMRFIYDHPEIAMVYTLGKSDFCIAPPKGGRKGGANLESIKLSGRYARMLNATPNQRYTMDEIIEMVKTIAPPEMNVTPAAVAGMLGLGAAVNPQEADLIFYKKFSEEYAKYLETKSFKMETLPPAPAQNGSFELWSYYHLGVPSFSMNLFRVPKVSEENGEEAESAEPKENEKKQESEKELEISEKDKALLAWSDREWQGKGFVQWTKVNHPSLGEVEVGGYVPYLETTPKPSKINYLLGIQLPWLLQLSKKLPNIDIEKMSTTPMGAGIYKLEIIITNNGELPYPTSMGERNGQPAPIILVLRGDIEYIEGAKRTQVGSIGVNQIKKLSWIIKSKGKATELSATLESVVFNDVVKQINIGG